MLCSGTAVEAAYKVMACIVGDCVFSHGLWQVEDAPVCYAADYAAGVQDYVAGCFCDSGERVRRGDGGRRKKIRTRGLRLGCLGAPVVVLAMRNVDMVSKESVSTTPMSS